MDIAGFTPVLITLILVALAFDFLNGLHDAANSIATIVSTRVLSARMAVIWAAFFNFIAFLFFGLHVAKTIGSGLVARCIYSIARVTYDGKRVSPVEAIYQTFVKVGFAPKNASLLFALCFVGFFYVLLRAAQKRGIVFKV